MKDRCISVKEVKKRGGVWKKRQNYFVVPLKLRNFEDENDNVNVNDSVNVNDNDNEDIKWKTKNE